MGDGKFGGIVQNGLLDTKFDRLVTDRACDVKFPAVFEFVMTDGFHIENEILSNIKKKIQ